VDTPRGLQPFQPTPTAFLTKNGKPLEATDKAASAAPRAKSESSHDIARNVYEPNGKDVTPAAVKEGSANGEANGTTLEDSLKEPSVRYNCKGCGNDCTAVRHHNVNPTNGRSKWPDVCPACWKGDKFASNNNRADFVLIETDPFPMIADSGSKWTETEELLLLEGLDMHDDNWDLISDHVGSRTREECVLKFLQLEIEDKYLEPNPVPNPVDEGVQDLKQLTYLNGGRVPFNQTDNPVLSTMSYLVGLADPSTTAAAAGRAVDEVRKTMRARLEKTSDDKGKEKEGSGSVKAEGAPATDMDVDSATSPQPSDSNALATRSKDADANPTTTLPFALSAARAAGLASHEERTLTRLVHTATNLQMEKLELKMRQFSELEAMLSAERRDLERRRQQLFLDRLQFQRRVRSVEEAFTRAVTLGSPQEGMKIVREAMGLGEGLVVKKVGEGEGGEVQPVEGKSFEV
jgi:SWI/SNF related-matrix-associated actin-dependent regulator of chromatin subfamily C